MAVSDNDVELLETYLDGELPTDACESLWRRVSDEPELALELERCRADRAIRQKIFASMEPADLAVARIEDALARVKRRHSFTSILTRSLSAISTAAACILFGFAMGWFGHTKYPASVPGASSASQGMGIVDSHNVRNDARKFIVNIQDEMGRIIATKQFDTAEDARRFADDVTQAQARHREVHDSPVVPVSDQF